MTTGRAMKTKYYASFSILRTTRSTPDFVCAPKTGRGRPPGCEGIGRQAPRSKSRSGFPA